MALKWEIDEGIFCPIRNLNSLSEELVLLHYQQSKPPSGPIKHISVLVQVTDGSLQGVEN